MLYFYSLQYVTKNIHTHVQVNYKCRLVFLFMLLSYSTNEGPDKIPNKLGEKSLATGLYVHVL